MSNTPTYDVIVVGAGIVGLAQAWSARERGNKVLVVERTAKAQGASVRNFGMIWPVGQPAGEDHATAMRSRDRWLDLGRRGVLNVESCGSLHVAHQDDEAQVLREFRDLGTHDVEWLDAKTVLTKSALVNPTQLRGALWSPTELRVDPRTASQQIASWLEQDQGVDFSFGSTATNVKGELVELADGRLFRGKRIVICSGSDLETLYPNRFSVSGLRRCKLQMFKASGVERVGPTHPHIASGLTLRHYTSFRDCPTLTALKDRIASETPELDRYGIHVMASHFENGDVILGDSHEYDDDISPFDNLEIDALMTRELKTIVKLSDWKVTERWHGIYTKHSDKLVHDEKVEENVRLFVGTGGAGMTLAFGLAERAWGTWGTEA